MTDSTPSDRSGKKPSRKTSKKTRRKSAAGASGKKTARGAGTRSASASSSKGTASGGERSSAASRGRAQTDFGLGDMAQFMTEMATTLTRNALQLAGRSRAVPGRLADVLFLDPKSRDEFKPEYLQMLADAGKYVKDARSVAGLTVDELGAALELKDRNLLKAVEAGTATLSFDLILRLASLLARHDPVPFVLRLARAYNPQAWQVLEKWGIGQIPLQLQREREFINIYRRHDEARKLSDKDFERVLAFTDEAFKLALHFSQHDADEDD